MWDYFIKEHELEHDGKFVSADCYSGHPPHVNDPSAIAMVGIGPLPPGDYTMLAGYDHPHLGPVSIPLQPAASNVMHNRGSFFIHPDSVAHPGYGSEGCITANHQTRVTVNTSTDRALTVHLSKAAKKVPPEEPVDS